MPKEASDRWKGVKESWNLFWFGEFPSRPLAIFRILFGTTVFLSALSLMPDIPFLYGPGGLAAKTPIAGFGMYSYFSAHPTAMPVMIMILAVSAIGLSIGIWTKISSVLVYFGLLFLFSFNPCWMSGGDQLQRLLSFFLIFSQAGAALSCDRKLGHFKSASVSSWPVRMMQIQISIVYGVTAIDKLKNPYWRDGTAVFYSVQPRIFGHWHASFLFQNALCIHAITWGTVLFELAMVGIWHPKLRKHFLWTAVLFHLSIMFLMSIYLFQLTMISSLFLFSKPEDFEYLKIKFQAIGQSFYKDLSRWLFHPPQAHHKGPSPG